VVGKHHDVRPKAVEQTVHDLVIMCLSRSLAEPDREALRIDDRLEFLIWFDGCAGYRSFPPQYGLSAVPTPPESPELRGGLFVMS
jgi:hypothetical protein